MTRVRRFRVLCGLAAGLALCALPLLSRPVLAGDLQPGDAPEKERAAAGSASQAPAPAGASGTQPQVAAGPPIPLPGTGEAAPGPVPGTPGAAAGTLRFGTEVYLGMSTLAGSRRYSDSLWAGFGPL